MDTFFIAFLCLVLETEEEFGRFVGLVNQQRVSK